MGLMERIFNKVNDILAPKENYMATTTYSARNGYWLDEAARAGEIISDNAWIRYNEDSTDYTIVGSATASGTSIDFGSHNALSNAKWVLKNYGEENVLERKKDIGYGYIVEIIYDIYKAYYLIYVTKNGYSHKQYEVPESHIKDGRADLDDFFVLENLLRMERGADYA